MHLSLRLKIVITLVGLVLLLGLGATFHARNNLLSKLERSLEASGQALARDLASRSADALLTGDTFELYQGVNDTFLASEDVRYVYVVDSRGEVRAHTFEAAMPSGLRQANVPAPGTNISVVPIETDEGKVIDIAAPSFDGQAGVVHVGMSEQRIRAEVNGFVRELATLVAIVVGAGIVASYVLASFLTRPVTRLVQAVRRAARGDFRVRVPEGGGDEIAKLSRSFNLMAAEIARSRDQLLRRNMELTVLNAVADAVSRPHRLGSLLDDALDRLIEMMGLRSAWVFTYSGEDGHPKLASYRGQRTPEALMEQQCTLLGPCRSVLEHGDPLIISDSAACPFLAAAETTGDGPKRHASLALRSTTSVLGILNVIPSRGHDIGEDDLRLLSAVARQIGTAMENVRLYEELRRKEEVRSRLLQQVISAQEEERKRIARELHDELAQRLTGLSLALEMAMKGQLSKDGLSKLRRQVRRSLALTSDALDETRKLILDLRPTQLDDMGLVPSIQWYVEERLQRSGVEVNFQVEGTPHRLPPTVETCFFRIMQEAINNVIRHAQSSAARVRLVFGEDTVIGEVEDNGVGFDMRAVLNSRNEQTALGILGMQERASLLGGHLQIRSRSASGTRLTVRLPVPAGARSGPT